jgi:hypothetical protein
MVAVESVAFLRPSSPGDHKEVMEHHTFQHRKSLGKVLLETLKDICVGIGICSVAQLEQLVLYWTTGKRCGRRGH